MAFIPVVSSRFVLVLCSLVLLSWFLGLTPMQMMGLQIVEMNATTAIAFLFSSLALLIRRHRLSLVCGSAVLLIGFLKLLFFAGFDTGIDWFYYKSHLGLFPIDSDNRMAPNTAFCFCILGMSLLALRFQRALTKEIFALMLAFVSMFALIGYLYRITSFYGVSTWIPMAPHTAFCFAVLSTGIVASSPQFLFKTLLNSNHNSGKIGRKFFPLVVFLPLILGWLRLQGEALHLYDTEAGVSLSTAMTILIMGTMTLWGISLLNKNEVILTQLNEDLEKKVLERIDELQKTEEQVRQLQKMDSIGRLAGGVAHDFNNMLAIFNLYCDYLRPYMKGEKESKAIEQMEKAVLRANALTKQLLAFSRQQITQLTAIDLNDLIKDFEKMLQRLIGENIQITTKLSPQLFKIKADQSHMEQVIMNLAVNARDAMPKGGKISIETSNVVLDESFSNTHLEVKPGNYVMLSVSDTGTGMSKEIQAKIFEPFFTTKGVGQGTGLGLATVYGIVKQSGGTIWVYSEIGKGTVFKIYFPIMEDQYVPTSASDTKEIIDLHGTESILLVEDDDDLRSLLSQCLQQLGYQVVTASNGKEALEIVQGHAPFDLVVSDVIMPQMTGPETILRLAEMKYKTKFLLLSGYIADTLDQYGKDWQQDVQILEKPFGTKILVTKIRELLS